MDQSKTVTAELVDDCKLRCALCWNRNRTPSGKQMELDIVSKILVRYRKRRIEWFNWGDPLLHTKFIEVAGMLGGSRSYISTNLSLSLSDATLDVMRFFKVVIVSLSGMDKDTYRIYHRGGDFELVMENLERLSRRANVCIWIRWLDHSRNKSQLEACKAFCVERNFKFMVQTLNCEIEDLLGGFSHELLHLDKTVRWSNCKRLSSIVIGVDGQYLVCCASHNIPTGYTIDDNITIEDLIAAKQKNLVCLECNEKRLWRNLS